MVFVSGVHVLWGPDLLSGLSDATHAAPCRTRGAHCGPEPEALTTRCGSPGIRFLGLGVAGEEGNGEQLP